MKRRLRKPDLHETERTEFFSDAVFAVAITLLALDLVQIRAEPEGPDRTMFAALGHYWPVLLAFAASFAFIGVTWMNHHSMFARVKLLSRSMNAANLLLLACTVMIPWVTSALAEALSLPGNQGEQEVFVYSTVLALNAVTWFILFTVLARNPELLVDPTEADGFARDRFSALAGIGAAVIGTAIAYLWSPVAATALLFGMSIFYAIVSPGFESIPEGALEREGRAPNDTT